MGMGRDLGSLSQSPVVEELDLQTNRAIWFHSRV